MRSIRIPSGGAFTRLTKTFEELKKDVPGLKSPDETPVPSPFVARPLPERITVVEPPAGAAELVHHS